MVKRRSGESSPESESDYSQSPSRSRRNQKRTRFDDENRTNPAGISQGPSQAVIERLEQECLSQMQSSGRVNGKQRAGTAASSGIIESIEMVNFMCHKNFSMAFGDRLNFIVGQNGSGKSAILSAITLALGGKANLTGRGTGIKAFVQDGESLCEVCIKLKNGGPDAYHPELYGSTISIVRRFNKAGASTYKIESAKGKVVSKSKKDVDKIREYFQLQVDNPLCVLNQDASRKFLGSTNPHEKYMFFLQGTQLLQLETEYAMIAEDITLCARTVNRRRGELSSLKEAEKEARAAHAEGLKAQKKKDRAATLKREQAWAHVRDKQNELDEKQNIVGICEERLQRANAKVPDTDAIIAETTKIMADLEHEREELLQRAAAQQTARDSAKAKFGEQRKELLRLRSEERKMVQDKQDFELSLEDLRAKLSTEEAAQAEASQAASNALNSQILALQAEIAMLQDQFEAAQHTKGAVEKDSQKYQAELAKALEAIASSESKCSGFEKEIKTCKAQAHDQLAAFGSNLDNVIATVKKSQWSGQMPIGPLGQYVELTNADRWGDVMRNVIGRLMFAWMVSNTKDLKQLREILVRNGNRSPSIIVSAFEEFDYSAGEPPVEYPTPLRLLKITNNHVARCIINSAKIERMYLADDRPSAEKLMDQRRHGVVLTSNGLKVTRFEEDGGRKTEVIRSVANGDPRNRLFRGKGQSAQINHFQQVLESEKENLHRARANELRLRPMLQELKADQIRAATAARDSELNLHKKRRALKTVEEELRSAAPVDIAVLRDAIREMEDKKSHLLNQYANLQDRKAVLELSLKPMDSKLADFKREAVALEKKANEITPRIHVAAQAQLKAKNDKGHYETSLEKKRSELQAAQEMAEVCAMELTNWSARAAQVGEKFVSDRPTEQIVRECKAVSAAVKTHNQTLPKSLDELVQERDRAIKAHENAKKGVDAMEDLVTTLHHSHHMRVKRWGVFLAWCSMSCKESFTNNLAMRGYYGKAYLDHDNRTLNLKIQTEDQAADESATPASHKRIKDISSLSGGEKSYASICLLTSLWDTTSPPIRCLDEFDVFMDEINRKIAVRLLIDNARAAVGKQYIVISPLKMSNSVIEDWMTVLKMDDPERTQDE